VRFSMNRLVAVLALMLVASRPPHNLLAHRPGLWSIEPTPTLIRWIEIHHLDDAARSGIFHVEVLARVRGEPASKVQHVAPHLAITTAALQRSVLGPLTRGSVYPETFDGAYAAWKKARDAGGPAPICESSVLECLGAARE
jgi:hypothetical protein